jgi:hypothetical protein
LGKKVVFFAHHSHADTSHKVKKVQKKILHPAASSILLKKEKRKKRREKEEGSTADQQRCRANPRPVTNSPPSYATHPCRPNPRSSSPVDPGPL